MTTTEGKRRAAKLVSRLQLQSKRGAAIRGRVEVVVKGSSTGRKMAAMGAARRWQRRFAATAKEEGRLGLRRALVRRCCYAQVGKKKEWAAAVSNSCGREGQRRNTGGGSDGGWAACGKGLEQRVGDWQRWEGVEDDTIITEEGRKIGGWRIAAVIGSAIMVKEEREMVVSSWEEEGKKIGGWWIATATGDAEERKKGRR
ncbi:hypothetical protein B296_00039799 [Ensete ventricosum]|uniref:Uncharacterized protein n=1 Tax=Ensete ventricosum TaxID=4639 RepID=A0A426ZS30_ENSVE|nr:hypothetical protein B296_00039799 [Ensete ventricosum]